MARKRIVRGGLIQCGNALAPSAHPERQSPAAQRRDVERVGQAMLKKHLRFVHQAGRKKVQVLCLQEIFNGPYFCAEEHPRWYWLAEPQDGPTVETMRQLAKRYKMVIVVPFYEKEKTGVYYNTCVLLDADGRTVGVYRKSHIPHVHPGFYEKYYFTPGNLKYPVFDCAVGKVGLYICYDRHFPDGARALGLNGAELVFNPSATITGVSRYLWELEQPAHALANGYFIGANNRVGVEKPWRSGEFYGSSYFADPWGKLIVQASPDRDELVIADMDFNSIAQSPAKQHWLADRRPDTYGDLVRPLP